MINWGRLCIGMFPTDPAGGAKVIGTTGTGVGVGVLVGVGVTAKIDLAANK